MTIFDYTKLNSYPINQILIAILKKDSAFLISHKNKKLTKKQINTINLLYKKYQNNWPLPYLLKYCFFYKLKLKINQNVLIPRPETEVMIDKIREKINDEKTNILDIGTGSGAIILNLAFIYKNRKNLKFFASDISKKALNIAKDNAKTHLLAKKVKFFHSNILDNIQLNNDNLIIAANLPYLKKNELKHPSLKKEPKLALDGKNDGLFYYNKLLNDIKRFSKIKKIIIFLEINPEQNSKIRKIIKEKIKEAKIKTHRDLRRKIRFIEIKINN